jgi:hypothetical protein
MDDDELRALATKRLKAKADFHQFLLVWLGVSVLVTVIWAVTNFGGYFWPGWVIGGMAVAAIFQAIAVYGPPRGVITEGAIAAEMNKLKGGPSA